MGRSQRLLEAEIERVKSALNRCGYPNQKALAMDSGLSPSTVKNFLNGKPVDYLNFVELCSRLSLDWKDVANPLDDDSAELENQPTFIAGPPIRHPRNFFGRERELRRLFGLLKTQPMQNAAIVGKPRSGKTSLLNYLRTITTTPKRELREGQRSDWLLSPKTYTWIYADFQDPRLHSRLGLMAHLLEGMGIDVPAGCSLEMFMEVVSDRVKQPTVVLMDEIAVGLQRCPELDDEFWESLRSLCNSATDGNLAFVLSTPEQPVGLAQASGHSSPFFNTFGYTAFIGSLTESEAREFVGSSTTAFAKEDVGWMLEASGRWPYLLQILCRQQQFSLEEGQVGDAWREEAMKQLTPFLYLRD
ncbi:MAG: ATP-binding protein [Cyanobacteria bacterium J06597_1]